MAKHKKQVPVTLIIRATVSAFADQLLKMEPATVRAWARRHGADTAYRWRVFDAALDRVRAQRSLSQWHAGRPQHRAAPRRPRRD